MNEHFESFASWCWSPEDVDRLCRSYQAWVTQWLNKYLLLDEVKCSVGSHLVENASKMKCVSRQSEKNSSSFFPGNSKPGKWRYVANFLCCICFKLINFSCFSRNSLKQDANCLWPPIYQWLWTAILYTFMLKIYITFQFMMVKF